MPINEPQIDSHGDCQCIFCRSQRQSAELYNTVQSPNITATSSTSTSTLSAEALRNGIEALRGQQYDRIEINDTIPADQVRFNIPEELETLWRSRIIPYTEERFGKSFKKEEPKVKRVNGVNYITINFSYRIDSYASAKQKRPTT